MSKPLRVLTVEDSEDDAQLVVLALRRGGFDVVSLRVDTSDAMQAALVDHTWDVVLSDYAMPHFSGPASLDVLKKSGLDIPFLIVSGKVGEEKAVELMRAGARDYILKDNLSRLVPAVERELQEAQGRRERRQLEEQFRQAQKMEALGQLAGGVAHDFNNLLTIINGYCELLLNMLKPEDPSRALLDQIKKAGDRSASLVRQLLIFSRKQVVSLRLLDLNGVICEAQKMLGRAIGENFKLITDLGARLRNIKADPGQMEQVIFNLVLNARDAMPEGGEITIRTSNRTFEEGYSRPLPDMPLGSYVLLEVMDTGIGMTPEVMARMFEPFFTTKEVGKGTGLGLATVFGIVKQSEGYIAVESHPGAGTTFRIFFPEAVGSPTETSSQQQAKPEGAPRGNEVILFAEDDDGVRKLLSQILVRSGYTVLEAKNGEEALGLAQKYHSPIHALVTDVVMPKMGGVDLAQRIQKIHPETKVLYVSGYPNHPDFRKESMTGKVEFLQKPLSPLELTTKIRAILDAPRPMPTAPMDGMKAPVIQTGP